MRKPSLVLVCTVAALVAAPSLASASVRMHMPHKRHHKGDDKPAADTPTSDIPDPVWTSTNTHR